MREERDVVDDGYPSWQSSLSFNILGKQMFAASLLLLFRVIDVLKTVYF